MQKKKLYFSLQLFTFIYKSKGVVHFANKLIEHAAQGPSRGDCTTAVLTRVPCALRGQRKATEELACGCHGPQTLTVQLVFGIVFPVLRMSRVRLPQGEC